MSEKTLLPCPFCGGEAHVELHRFYEEKTKDFTSKTYGVICDNCHTSGRQFYESEEEAIKAWNTRKPMQEIVKKLEEWKNSSQDSLEKCAFEKAIEIVKRGGVDEQID